MQDIQAQATQEVQEAKAGVVEISQVQLQNLFVKTAQEEIL